MDYDEYLKKLQEFKTDEQSTDNSDDDDINFNGEKISDDNISGISDNGNYDEKNCSTDETDENTEESPKDIPESKIGLLTDSDDIKYHDSTYEIVSKVGYLIGVPKFHFDNENEVNLKSDIYEELDSEKPAKIIRNLSITRTYIERNFGIINKAFRNGASSLWSMEKYLRPEVWTPFSEAMNNLLKEGVNFQKNSTVKLCQYIIELNRLISERINNCKGYFPLWLNWNYLKDLFIMPNGLKEDGTKKAAEIYYNNKDFYPYGVYINWQPEEEGNILYNDKKFITLLYYWHKEVFNELSRVSDVSDYVRANIYDFIDKSKKTVLIVDCENSDPFKLTAALYDLDDKYLEKISKIILVDDVHTTSAWKILEDHMTIPVEYNLIERLKEDKSLVDQKLTVMICEEYFKNDADSFILCSSDSDYWVVISSIPAKFLVMMERNQCGPDLKKALQSKNIFYCYLDDFYSGNADEFRFNTMFMEMENYIYDNMNINIYEMFHDALKYARLESWDKAERNQFFNKYIKTIQMEIEDNGDVWLKFKKRK